MGVRSTRPTRTVRTALFATLVGCSAQGPGGQHDSAPPIDTGVATPSYSIQAVAQHDFLDADRSNHLLPSSIAVDSEYKRAYSYSLGFGNIAVIDIDAGVVQDVFDIIYPLGTSRLQIDANHYVWLLANRSQTPALRIDPTTGEVESVETGLLGVAGLIPRDDGSVILFGFTSAKPNGTWQESGAVLVVIGEDLSVQETITLEHTVNAVSPTHDNAGFAIAVASEPPSVQIWSKNGLEQIGQCRLGLHPTSISPLSNGNFAVIDADRVGIANCDELDGQFIWAGTENKSVFPQGDGFMVMDRQSSEDPNWGELRSYDADLNQLGTPITSGKNSGFGAYDINTQQIWMNSEGTTELLAFSLADLDFVDSVQLGKHVESLAPAPNDPTQVVVAGRLSADLELVNLETNKVVPFNHDLTWPVSPCWVEDTVWVIDHLTSALHGFSSDTLEEIAEYPYDGSTDLGLTLSDIKFHNGRGTLFITNAPDDRLYEFDPNTGERLNAWDLGGTPLIDENHVARLEILWDDADIFVVRGKDGRITKIDIDTGESQTVLLLEDSEPGSAQLRVARLSNDKETLWIRGYAVDPNTLEFQTATKYARSAWSIPIGEIQTEDIAWRAPSANLVVLDDTRTVVGQRETTLQKDEMPEFHWLPEQDNTLLMTDLEGARVLTWRISP